MTGSNDSTDGRAGPSLDRPAARDRSLDVARGLAIIGVVLGHVVRGLFAAGLVDPSLARWAFIDRALYLFHLPVFAIATGLLMSRPVERDGQTRYLRGRLGMLSYVFLLWTLIEGTAEVLASSVKYQGMVTVQSSTSASGSRLMRVVTAAGVMPLDARNQPRLSIVVIHASARATRSRISASVNGFCTTSTMTPLSSAALSRWSA